MNRNAKKGKTAFKGNKAAPNNQGKATNSQRKTPSNPRKAKPKFGTKPAKPANGKQGLTRFSTNQFQK